MSGQIEMPKYKSHKEVWALKIKSVDATTVTPEDAGYAPFEVPEQYIAKRDPKAGGYYVVYEDGYQSFSPAEAFESGYTAVAPASPAASVLTDEQVQAARIEWFSDKWNNCEFENVDEYFNTRMRAALLAASMSGDGS